jgi:hypothetical protein
LGLIKAGGLNMSYKNMLLALSALSTSLGIVVVGIMFVFPSESKALIFGKSKEKYIYMCNSKSGLTEAHAGRTLIDEAAEYGWTFVQMTPGPCAVFKKEIH